MVRGILIFLITIEIILRDNNDVHNRSIGFGLLICSKNLWDNNNVNNRSNQFKDISFKSCLWDNFVKTK